MQTEPGGYGDKGARTPDLYNANVAVAKSNAPVTRVISGSIHRTISTKLRKGLCEQFFYSPTRAFLAVVSVSPLSLLFIALHIGVVVENACCFLGHTHALERLLFNLLTVPDQIP